MRWQGLDPFIGMRFGDREVVGLVFVDAGGRRRVKVRCHGAHCGGVLEDVLVYNLMIGIASSCRVCGSERRVKHGVKRLHAERDKLYDTWTGLRKRCLNENDKDYHRYGARGIMVDPEWDDFASFREWSLTMGGFIPGVVGQAMSIDRIDNDGNYGPDNCRWVDAITQANNRRSCRPVAAFGECKTVPQWMRDPRFTAGTTDRNSIYGRLKRGWPVELALTVPVGVALRNVRQLKPSHHLTWREQLQVAS